MTDLTPTPQGCGKAAYENRRDAEKAMRCLVQRKGRDPAGRGAGVYFCKHCNSFHFGHRRRGRSLTGVR